MSAREVRTMGKKIRFTAILAALCVVALGCSQANMRARNDMHQGKGALDDGNFVVAEELFARAAQAQPSGAAYAFAATAAYNANDLQNAVNFIEAAARFKSASDVYPRIQAYKALIFFRQGRYAEAMDAIDAYLAIGKTYYPIRNADIVRRMTAASPIDLVYLQALLEYDVRRYESDITQWQNEGTGYFSYKYGTPFVRTVPEW
jgi:tetratricopeptide (TPR) repeat protein